ncbi:unnamed protein product [Effrenium voratum]|uniref:C3H1-type domain-containing protein n=1 Tax=Effrenium voratum TaxID=2562239 RepID=A0AA36IGI7_9DINO|nr:unnamed protein product [Effrenium voratum]
MTSRGSAGPLPFQQRGRHKATSLQSGPSTPTSSLHTTIRSGSPHSPTASSNTSRDDGAEEHYVEGVQLQEAKTPKILWAATPTPKASQATYSFALPPQPKLNAEAKAFVPDTPQAPVTAKIEEPSSELHAEAQAVMMAESVLGLDAEPTSVASVPTVSPKGPEKEVLLPSKGSTLHQQGQCRPCAWMWKPKGCQNATSCEYCHLCPEGELKHRKKLKIAAIRMGALGPSTDKAGKAARRDLKLSSLL